MTGKCASGCGLDAVSTLIKAAAGTSGRSPFAYYQYDSNTVAMTALGTSSVTIQTLPDSIFVGCYLMAIAFSSTAIIERKFTTQMVNGATGRYFNDAPVHSDLLWGRYAAGETIPTSAAQPSRLIDPIILPPSSNLVLTFVDLSNNGSYSLFVALGGYRWYDMQNPPKLMKENAALQWYTYSQTQTLSGGQGPSSFITRIDADADFLVRKINAFSTGLFSLNVSDASTTDPWFQNNEPAPLLAGNAMWPNVLAKPRIVRRNSAIQTVLQDLSGSSNTVRVVYEGAKVYR